MSDSDYDEDLKQAIALSLQENSPPKPKPAPIIIDLLSSDDEDEAPIIVQKKKGPINGRGRDDQARRDAHLDAVDRPERVAVSDKRSTSSASGEVASISSQVASERRSFTPPSQAGLFGVKEEDPDTKNAESVSNKLELSSGQNSPLSNTTAAFNRSRLLEAFEDESDREAQDSTTNASIDTREARLVAWDKIPAEYERGVPSEDLSPVPDITDEAQGDVRQLSVIGHSQNPLRNLAGNQDEEDEASAAKTADEHHQSHASAPSNKTIQCTTAIAKETTTPSSVSSSGGLQALNRKQMEEERLLRAQKKREGTAASDAGVPHKRKPSTSSPQLQGRPQKLLKIAAHEQADANIVKDREPSIDQNLNVQASASTGIQYPYGVVKKTWALGIIRGVDDIKIEEVLQKDTLQLAVLSAFQVEPDWITSKMKPDTRVIWVLQAKTPFEKENLKSLAPDNYKFCFPSMEGQINCMHSKLQLLAHPTHLRVVIPSANLTPYDWGETGVMENTCFLIDLPRLPDGQVAKYDQLTEFGKELIYFLEAKGLDGPGFKLATTIRKFDFSQTSKFAFVHSIGGSHLGDACKRTGYCGLGTAINSLGLSTCSQLNIDYVTSSIGNIKLSFLKDIYLAAQGDDGFRELEDRTIKLDKLDKMGEQQNRSVSENIENGFRVYFPTRKTVAESKGTTTSGGTICFQPQWYDAQSFPRCVLRDCKSVRDGMLMHNKLLFCRSDHTQAGESNNAWVYVGSANLSESAWGRKVLDKKTNKPKLNLRNWECGVIVKASMVPIPMIIPGEEYRENRPWFYSTER